MKIRQSSIVSLVMVYNTFFYPTSKISGLCLSRVSKSVRTYHGVVDERLKDRCAIGHSHH